MNQVVRHPRVNLVSNNSSLMGIAEHGSIKRRYSTKHFCYQDQVSMNSELVYFLSEIISRLATGQHKRHIHEENIIPQTSMKFSGYIMIFQIEPNF